MPPATPRLFVPVVAMLLLAGCAEAGDFPSLAKRPFETGAMTQGVADAPPAPLPAPSVSPLSQEERAKLNAALDQHRAAAAAFAAALPDAQNAGGGAVGGEGWAVAQRALSRLEAARAGSVDALADLDRLAVMRAEAEEAGAAPGGVEELDNARAPVAAAVEEQRATLDRLAARLGV